MNIPKKPTKYEHLVHGRRVKCKIDGEEISDAKLNINKFGHVFVCQNIKGSKYLEDKLGYDYSWWLFDTNPNYYGWNEKVTDLEYVDEPEEERTLDETLNLIVVNTDGTQHYLQVVPPINKRCFYKSSRVDGHKLIIDTTCEPINRKVTMQEIYEIFGEEVEIVDKVK